MDWGLIIAAGGLIFVLLLAAVRVLGWFASGDDFYGG